MIGIPHLKYHTSYYAFLESFLIPKLFCNILDWEIKLPVWELNLPEWDMFL